MLDPRLNRKPQKIETIHLMGICGTGMAALAGMLKNAGYAVTGSDAEVYPPMSDFLYRQGIAPAGGYRAENLGHGPDLVIVGNVIRKDNPEALALGRLCIAYLSFPQALAEFFLHNRRSLVVAGTHGKTTTCALLASTLHHAGCDPSFMIGGILREFESNNRLGGGPHFVVEGDEYDTAFFDKESKFLHYQPQTAIITSIEFDHADIFTDLDQIKRSFGKFVRLLPPEGLIVAHLDDANVREVVAEAPCRVEGYGLGADNDWRIVGWKTKAEESLYEIEHRRQKYLLASPLSGVHNGLNSLAVMAVLHSQGLDFDSIAKGVSAFKGVKRRQEVRGTVDGITVLDDFAHHPTAVRETLDGLKKANHERRLVAVFEPRTNSSRRSLFQEQYARAFSGADVVVLREPIPLDNVAAEDHFSSAKLAESLRRINKKAWSFSSTDHILDHLAAILRKGDMVAILSNGGFDNIHERLLAILKHRR